MSTQTSNWIESFAKFLIRWRWPVLALSVIVTMLIGMGAQRIAFRNDYRVFFSADNPELAEYEKFQKIYTREDNVLFVLTHAENDLFTPAYLEAVQWLTEETWTLPFTTRVDSVVNYQHSEAEEDDLVVGDLVEDPMAASEEDLLRYKAIAETEPLIANKLIGSNPKSTGINVTMLLPDGNSFAPVEAAVAARELRDQFQEKFAGFRVDLTGMVMMNNAFAESSMKDMQTLIPLMYFGMFIVMAWMLRSTAGTLGTIFVVTLSSIIGMGAMGWIGFPMSPPVATAPIMIMTLAIADSIHLFVTFLHRMREGLTKEAAIIDTLRVNMQPVFLTSLTTIVGFLSLNFSDAPPFRVLGNVVAIGVAGAWVVSIVFLPAWMAVMPFKVRLLGGSQGDFLERFANLIIRRRVVSFWGSVAVIAVLAAFIPRIELNDQWVKYFGNDIEFRHNTDYAMENLTGIYTVEYSIESGESGGINNPEYLKNLDELSLWLRRQPEVVQVNSMTDIMRRLNKNMHGDDEAYYRIPESRELAAQFLLLFEMSLPYGLDLNNTINVDKSASRLTVTTSNITTREVRGLGERTAAWQEANLPKVMHAPATSPTVMFSHISERNIISMLSGTTIAIFIISAILAIALKSFRYGALSLVPNLVPAILGFGAWSLFIGSVGMSLSVVTGMTLGIVVDDTVHFLSKYIRARREKGYSAEDAVRYAFETVGPALIATTIILLVGFGILSFSSFRLNNWMAQLTAIVIAFALIADLILLPALLLLVDRKNTNSKTEPANIETKSYESKHVTA